MDDANRSPAASMKHFRIGHSFLYMESGILTEDCAEQQTSKIQALLICRVLFS
jgi:hypothetical protein